MKPNAGGEGGDGEDQAKAKMELDEDYCAFMAELDGKPRPAPNGDGTEGQTSGVVAPLVSGVTTISSGGPSYLTVIQPAKVVEVNENGESVETPTAISAVDRAASLPAVASAIPEGCAWRVTTISAAKTVAGDAVPAADLPEVTSILSSMAPAAASADVSSLPPPPVAPNAVPTDPSIPAAVAPVALGLPPPPPPAGLPPPPAGLPPPPPQGAYPGQQQQYNPYPQHPPPMGYQQPPPPPMGYPQQPPPPMGYPQQPPPPMGYPQQPPPQQQQWNAAAQGGTGETAGWDPNSYYNNGGDATGGAGGFNWWE